MSKTDATTIRQARLARVRMIRRRVVAGTVALFVATWLLITLMLVTGHDPALAGQTTTTAKTATATKTATTAPTATTSTQTVTAAGTATNAGSSSSTGSGSSSAGTSSVTSRQS
jgi:uncharacterized membrane protein YgcG